MTDRELLAAFRQTKNRLREIYKLAEQDRCTPFEIATRLEELGELVDTGLDPQDFLDRSKPHVTYGRPPLPFDEQLARQLYDEELCDTEIAQIMKINTKRVERWRKRNGLPKRKYRRKR